VIHRFVSLAGDPLAIELPPATRFRQFFALAPNKAGSVLLFNLVGELARAAGRSVVNLPGQAFAQGVHVRTFHSTRYPYWRRTVISSWDIGRRAAALATVLSEVPEDYPCSRSSRHRGLLLFFSSPQSSHSAICTASEALENLRKASNRPQYRNILRERHADIIFENMRRFASNMHRLVISDFFIMKP